MKLAFVRDFRRSSTRLSIVRSRAALPSPAPAESEQAKGKDEFEHIKRFETSLDLSSENVKNFTPVKEGDKIVDYSMVTIKGYLSTFQGTTPYDRDGDWVEPGAFTDTLKDFMKNPVMLRDHMNRTSSIAGKFTKIMEDKNGLYVEAELSQSPDNIDLRFKVVEGSARALSMAGIFYYREGGHAIFRVALWEGSIVAIPANPDALFRTRSLNDAEKKWMRSGKSISEFLAVPQNHLEVAA